MEKMIPKVGSTVFSVETNLPFEVLDVRLAKDYPTILRLLMLLL
jgi:hypothetical protein